MASPPLIDCHAHLCDPLFDADRRQVLDRARLVAIGEVGLDHWKVKEPADRETQREIFRRFVQLAAELDLPLNVHSRSAGRHAVSLLLEQDARRVQLHAFDGKPSSALPAAGNGQSGPVSDAGRAQ